MIPFRLLLLMAVFCLFRQGMAAQSCTGSGTKPVVVENCTATSTPEDAFVTISPNPAGDFFVVKNTGGAIHFELLDLQGKKILKQPLAGASSIEIDTRSLPGGTYTAIWYPTTRQKAFFSRIVIVR